MDVGREIQPLFFEIQNEIKLINNRPDEAKAELIARNPVLFKKTMFRAFLNYEKKEVKKMSIQSYMDSCIMLDEVLKLWHAPFMKNDDVD